MVEEAAMAAAEEADNGQGGQCCAVYSSLSDYFLTVTATATEGQGYGAAAVVSSADPFS
jgi:hypothetical protein